MTAPCTCAGDDVQLARAAIQKADFLAELIDESHFGVSLKRCAHCGQHFLTVFCERVDWVDGDDPQVWLAAMTTPEEARRLQNAGAVPEARLLEFLPGERRFLFMDAPKGAATLSWRNGRLFIPAHD